MNVVLVGQMVASTNGLSALADALRSSGHEVSEFLANGKTFPDGMMEKVQKALESAHFLVTGMCNSFANSREELAAIEHSIDLGIPFGLYADTFGVWNRPHFNRVSKAASLLFVPNVEEAEAAASLFSKAKIVVSGNPSWEAAFFPKIGEDLVSVRRVLGLHSDQRGAIIPLGKNECINKQHIELAIAGLGNSANHSWHAFVSIHPGDERWQKDPDAYQEFAGQYPNIVVKVVPRELRGGTARFAMPGSVLLAGMDLVLSSASGIGAEASCRRIPVVNVWSEDALVNLEQATGSRIWPPVIDGTELEVNGDPVLIGSVIDQLISGVSDLAPRQATVYPRPISPGDVAKAMASAVEEVATLD